MGSSMGKQLRIELDRRVRGEVGKGAHIGRVPVPSLQSINHLPLPPP